MRKLTSKAKLNIVMFGVWVAALITSVMIPTQWYGNYVFNNKVENNGKWTQFMDGYPSVSYTAKVVASTDGVFSIANPIDIEVTVSNANVTDLTNYYQEIRFLDAEKFTSVGIPLNPSPNGGWIAKDEVRFFEADRIWMFLAPKPPDGASLVLFDVEADYIRSQEHLFELGPASDTLTLQFNSFAVKVAFIFGTFSILLLAPIFEAIFIHEKKNESSNKTDNAENKGKHSKN